MKLIAIALAFALTGCAGIQQAPDAVGSALGFQSREARIAAAGGAQMHSADDVARFTAKQEAEQEAKDLERFRRSARIREADDRRQGWVNGVRTYTCDEARLDGQRLACALAEAGIDAEVTY